MPDPVGIDVYVAFRDGRNAKIANVIDITVTALTPYTDGDTVRDIFDPSPFMAATGETPIIQDMDYPVDVGGWTSTLSHSTTDAVIHMPLPDDWAHVPSRIVIKSTHVVKFTLGTLDPKADVDTSMGVFFFAPLIVGISTDPPSG